MKTTRNTQSPLKDHKKTPTPPFRRMICLHAPIVAILMAVTLSLLLGVLSTAGPSLAQMGPTDPAADYQVWRDDEIFFPGDPNGFGKLLPESYEYAPGAGTVSELSYCGTDYQNYVGNMYNTQMGAAAGHIMSPYYDQVIYASVSTDSQADLRINFADSCDQVTHLPIGPSIKIGPQASMPALGEIELAGMLPRFYDIATGDLDKQTDAEQEEYRDEVVVAYAGDTGNPDFFSVIIAVLDYTEASVTPAYIGPALNWVSITDAIPRNIVSPYIGYAAIPMAVTTGDFDGDNIKEIAVAYLHSTLTIGVAVFRYTTTEDGEGELTHSLNLVQSKTLTADNLPSSTPGVYLFYPTFWVGSVDAAAGDLDGDGRDELSVGASVRGKNSSNGLRTGVDLKTFRFNDDLFITEVGPNTYNTIPYSLDGAYEYGVLLATGLFKFFRDPNPLLDYGMNRRQLAVAVVDPKNEQYTQVFTLVYDTYLQFNPSHVVRRSIHTGSQNLSMAAGGFNGLRSNASNEDMVWSLALGTRSILDGINQTLFLFDTTYYNGNLKSTYFSKMVHGRTTPSVSKTSILPLVAYDHGFPKNITETTTVLAGDSMYLGAPLYMILEGALTFDYILQEPPKHVWWDAAHNAVQNISGKDLFRLGTKDSKAIGVTDTYKDNFDSSWGVSVSPSVTISRGAIGNIKPPNVEATLSETLGYDYTYHDATYDKNTETRTVTIEADAVRDDALKYRIQDINVWRYYVYGANFEDLDNNPMVGFFDITGPTTVSDPGPTSGMAVLDIYQPVHENNNILSYPPPTASDKYDPPDMGSFNVLCTDPDCFEPVNEAGCECQEDPETGNLVQTIYGPLVNDGRRWTWGGISGTQELVDNRSETYGKERSTSKKMTASEDVKGTFRCRIPFTKTNLSGTLDIAAHESWNWSDNSTMETTTSELKSISLTIPTGDVQNGYYFYPTFYIAKDGTMRVSFAVNPMTDNSELFWKGLYGGHPDPALNLPNRFKAWIDAGVTKWDPYLGDERKLIRGFFVRHSEADEVTGEYTEYSGPPSAGDVVRLECRVYNYSTGQNVTNLKVRFEYVEIDQASGEEIGTRETIDDTVIPFLGPRGMDTAAVNWLIPEFSDNESKDYKIYVVLDPDNAIPNEKYETESAATRTYCPAGYDCMDPGQNNEGWRKMTALASLPGDPLSGHPAADVHLKNDALAAINPRGELVTTTVQAYERQPLKIRVRIDTDNEGADSAHLLLFDGDPHDGKLIANRLSYTGDPDGNYVWIEWVPTELGLHRLYAKVVESTLDTNWGNNISDELKVVVIKAPKGPQKPPSGPKK